MINKLEYNFDMPLLVEGNNVANPSNEGLLHAIRIKVADVLQLGSPYSPYENHRSTTPRKERPLLGSVASPQEP